MAGGSCPTTPTLVGAKILLFAVKVLYIQNFGRTNNYLLEIFLKWSDQSPTPSANPEEQSENLLNTLNFSCFHVYGRG